MKLKNTIRTLGLTLALVVAASCARGKVGQVAMPLMPKAFDKQHTIWVKPFIADKAEITGDKANDSIRIDQEKAVIKTSYAKKVALELTKRGYKATASDTPIKADIMITGEVTKIDHGSGAARYFVGMGAGSADMFTNVMIKDEKNKKALSEFQIIATSGGSGGATAMGSFMEAHLSDGSEKIAQFIDDSLNGKK